MGKNEDEYLERGRRRLAEGEERLERLKAHARAYSILLGRGSDYIEQAYLTYMEGERVEDWEAFERWMRAAVANFKSCVEALHKIAEITPSSVEPERYTEMKDLIRKTNDTLLSYHEKWGKRMKADEVERVMAMTHWTCASLQAAGIRNADMESKAGEAYCHNECRYRETCDREGL